MAKNDARYKFEIGKEKLSKGSSVEIEIMPLPLDMIHVEKIANPISVYVGEEIDFSITVTIGAIPAKLKKQSIVDELPKELQFVPNSLKVDGVATSGNIANLNVDFEPNTSHRIEYKCLAK